MSKIIAFNGKKRSGKDYNAKLLKEKLEDNGYSVAIISFAYPIKDIIAKTFNISVDDVELYKNESDEYGLEIKVYPNNQPSGVIKYIDMREILQRFGTEAMKPYFGKAVWANLTYNKIEEIGCDYSIIPDFRFPEEYREDIITVKVKNDVIDNSSTDSHSSENSLNDFNFNYIIDNTGYCDTNSQLEKLIENLIME